MKIPGSISVATAPLGEKNNGLTVSV